MGGRAGRGQMGRSFSWLSCARMCFSSSHTTDKHRVCNFLSRGRSESWRCCVVSLALVCL